jgi:signal transduction histidine kinase
VIYGQSGNEFYRRQHLCNYLHLFSRIPLHLLTSNDIYSMKKLWKKLSHLGINKDESLQFHRDIILLNQNNALLGITMSIELIMEAILFCLNLNDVNVSTLRIFLLVLLCTVNLYFSYKKKFITAKVLTIVFFPFFLFLFPILVGFYAIEIYLWYPFAAIALSIIPLLVFNPKTERKLRTITLWYLFAYVFFIDLFALAIGAPNFLNLDLPRLIFSKMAQTGIFCFVIFSVYYLININKKFEEQLIDANNDILDKSNLLEQQSNELKIQNLSLKEHKEELQTKNLELNEFQKELNRQNEELKSTMNVLKSTQSQLIHSEKMASLGVLTAGIAHEINNPINFINSGVSGLKSLIDETYIVSNENVKNEKDLQKRSNKITQLNSEANLLINHIEYGITRTTDIIKGLSKFSRMENSKLELSDINQTIDSTLSIISGRIKDRIEIVKQYSQIPPIYCYPVSLGQIILNLLSNAIQSHTGKGVVKISTNTDNEFVQISISDNGSGISPEIQSKIFEPFFTTKEVGQGTGLGLSITYGLVEKHMGNISFETTLGKGTTFIVKIPVDLKEKIKDQ